MPSATIPDEILLDLLRTDPTFETSLPHYVSIYRQIQRYGGPEEGGWWKDYIIHEGSIRYPNRHSAERNLQRITDEADTKRLQLNRATIHQAFDAVENALDLDDSDLNRGSSLGNDSYLVVIERIHGARDNTNEPIGNWDD